MESVGCIQNETGKCVQKTYASSKNKASYRTETAGVDMERKETVRVFDEWPTKIAAVQLRG